MLKISISSGFWLGLLLHLGGCTAEQTIPESTTAAAAATFDWQEIYPGGAAICSDGSPYKFLTRKGSADKLLVYLQGGGACWFRQNCDPAM